MNLLWLFQQDQWDSSYEDDCIVRGLHSWLEYALKLRIQAWLFALHSAEAKIRSARLLGGESEMKIKSLEIRGFRFHDKTVFDFRPGITAVVGPNGSGKSNVLEAIRWVMDEQRVRSLRGKKWKM